MFFEKDCPSECISCQHKFLPEEESILRKTEFLKKKLKKWDEVIHKLRALKGQKRYQYRKKVCLYAHFNGKKWQFGLLSHKQFIAIPHCPVHSPEINKTLEVLSEVLPSYELFPMKFFIQSGKQVMLVLKTHSFPKNDWLTDSVKHLLAMNQIEGLSLHLNPSAGNKIFMKHNFFLLYGQEFSQDETGMYYGPLSFQQQIPELFFDSLLEAEMFLYPNKQYTVIDLYSGIGYSIKQWFSSGAATIGVELNGEAVKCCNKNIPHVEILRGKCSDRIPQLNEFVKKNAEKNRLIYVNPPRIGMENKISEWIVNGYRPLRIAYLSCSPGTLARDLEYLCRNDYKVDKIIPYDFFPLTHHIECLALLEK